MEKPKVAPECWSLEHDHYPNECIYCLSRWSCKMEFDRIREAGSKKYTCSAWQNCDSERCSVRKPHTHDSLFKEGQYFCPWDYNYMNHLQKFPPCFGKREEGTRKCILCIYEFKCDKKTQISTDKMEEVNPIIITNVFDILPKRVIKLD